MGPRIFMPAPPAASAATAGAAEAAPKPAEPGSATAEAAGGGLVTACWFGCSWIRARYFAESHPILYSWAP